MSSGTSEPAWFESSHSGPQGDSRVEAVITEQAVHVRDSRDVARPCFAVGREGRGRFVRFASERRAT
ncbi:hypothetical protein SUDANB15_05660 [Streptomyces sp. enrichment culture]|uniref:DUF397 domain-containing protein n=1 Tax=Streptomyces sp. enrichment culture TaxID=1795815 RepID=UPI003F558903